MKIVIANDSYLMRERIKILLKDFENVSLAGETDNGKEALEMIIKLKPDLVILDIRMPELNGIELIKKIKELKLKSLICILTNYPYPQYKRKCLDEGADYFLSKTEDFEKINSIIHDFLK